MKKLKDKYNDLENENYRMKNELRTAKDQLNDLKTRKSSERPNDEGAWYKD